MIRPGDILRADKPLLVRETHRDARERKTWVLVEVEIRDDEIDDRAVTVGRS